MNFPSVKGWVPFKGSENQNKEKNQFTGKLKNVKSDNIDDSEKVDIPENWKPEPFKIEDNPNKRLFASSEFVVLYPKALDEYLKEVFPIVKKALQEHYIKAEMNRLDGELIVKTTPKTFDPFILLKASSVVKALARYVPVEESLTLLDEDTYEDIISIGHRKQDTFIKRRSRIDNDEIKELIKEVLDCKIFVSGKSVAAIGPFNNLQKVRKLVTECFEKNIHPVYQLKRYQIMNKLAVLPEMRDKDWTNFLPPIPKKKNVKRKVPHKVNVKGEYTPFAEPHMESKIDKELESGLFHLKYKPNKKNKRFEPVEKKRRVDED